MASNNYSDYLKKKNMSNYLNSDNRVDHIKNFSSGYNYLNSKKKEIIKEINNYNKTILKNNLLYKNLFHKYVLNIANPNDKIKYRIIFNNFTQQFREKKYYAHLHCYDISRFNEIYGKYIDKISEYFSVIVTYSIGENTIYNDTFVVLKIPNKGMDIGAKFCAVAYLNDNKISYEYILFLHSKSNPETRKKYFQSLINNLDDEFIESINNYDGYFPDIQWEIVGDRMKWISNNPEFKNHENTNWPERNLLYRNELLNYLGANNKTNHFIEGNCYILSKKVVDKLYTDPVLYNILNTENSFDYNWVSKAYNIQGDIYDVYKEFTERKLEPRNRYSYDGYLEHVLERVVLNFCNKYKIFKKINLIGLKNINCSINDNLLLLVKYFNNYHINLVDIRQLNNIDLNCHSIICLQPFEFKYINFSIFKIKPSVLWVWEFKSLPNIFIKYEKSINKIYVPSTFCYNIFSNHFNIPVEVINLKSLVHDYIDQLPKYEINNTSINYILKETQNKIKIGSCVDLNSSIIRKNILNIVKAFNFFKIKNICLILKFRKPRNFLNKIEKNIYDELKNIVLNNENIYIIDEELEKIELYKLYTYFDYYISAHCGEGFGFCIYDNLILGNKIISTYYSGEKDYLNLDNFIELKYNECNIPNLNHHDIYGQMSNYKGAYVSIYNIYLVFQNLFKYKILESIKIKDFSSCITVYINNKKNSFCRGSSCIIKNIEKENSYYLNFRWINYQLDDNGNCTYSCSSNISKNSIQQLDNNLNVISKEIFNNDNILLYKKYNGFEDVRIFNFKGDIYYSGTIFVEKKIGVSINKIDNLNNINYLKKNYITPSFPTNNTIEKNWALFEYKNKLRVIYTWYPIIICEVDFNSNKLNLLEEKVINIDIFRHARGSTCGVNYNNEIWFILHHTQIIDSVHKANYLHFFAVFDENMNLKRYSEVFKFENHIVEFCLGFIIEKERIIISYSCNDCISKVGIFDNHYITNVLNWFII
tara:strand:- start:2176 stop:5139 length:2964 start_codon:yes stop_codon:yes gene_type:complete